MFDVIYNLLDDAREKMTSMLVPEQVETEVGKLTVKAIFRTMKDKSIVGGEVTEGKISKGLLARVIRSKEVISEVSVESVQRQQSEAKEVFEGEMCGMSINTDRKVAIEEGFNRAWTSIRDGNLSTLITCFVLISFGTSFVQGFAITLSIGVLLSMFTAITITRVMLRFVAPWFKKRDGGILFLGIEIEVIETIFVNIFKFDANFDVGFELLKPYFYVIGAVFFLFICWIVVFGTAGKIAGILTIKDYVKKKKTTPHSISLTKRN
jgi:hypothetical protein